MSQPINRYKADLRDIRFVLFEQFKLQDLLGKAPYANWGQEEVATVLEELYGWAKEQLGPLNATGDAAGCTLEAGKIKTPPGFKEAWKSLYDVGWRRLSVPEKFGGQEGPFTLHAVSEEIMCGANAAFNMYPALTQGVADVIQEFGTPEQMAAYCPKLHDGTYAGTMCLTEPHAGSDVGSATTKAFPMGGGKYKLKGTKIFISGGDQDLSKNILHLVLARTEDAPAGTKGLSLFVVPRDRSDGTSNDVQVGSIEHKMGIKASSTAVLNFGENDNCIGELVGTEEQKGMSQMFHLMNYARIGVGVQGLGVASSAYLNALEYAKDRKQGPSIKQWKDAAAPRVPIIEHPDVRRMLLDMKAKVEGIRALIIKLAVHIDKVNAAGGDKTAAEYHQGQVDLLVPLVKAYGSDTAFQVCVTAIQTLGGAGFLKDYPIEQYARDSKIFSIYEGTNHIQALDLVGRKLGQRGGANLQAFIKDVQAFAATIKDDATYKDAAAGLSAAAEAVMGTAMRFLGWFGGGKMEMVPLAANRFLEMMSETAIGWLLLEQAAIGEKALATLAADHPDRAFYTGKRYAALFYAANVLATVPLKAAQIGKEDRTPVEIPTEAFATV
ncbi:MAG: acyl-CoA dehydrogenase [Kofleriaceae bacterium]|nr:acyl-CoA dehydrogenase [Kofleriaceae bacterium]MCL4223364.1 acyl-CoA dehydrogenase C-terminal domain-containing protein [Myxococcales bacterium]